MDGDNSEVRSSYMAVTSLDNVSPPIWSKMIILFKPKWYRLRSFARAWMMISSMTMPDRPSTTLYAMLIQFGLSFSGTVTLLVSNRIRWAKHRPKQHLISSFLRRPGLSLSWMLPPAWTPTTGWPGFSKPLEIGSTSMCPTEVWLAS